MVYLRGLKLKFLRKNFTFEKLILYIHSMRTGINNELEPEKDLTTRNFGRGLFGRPIFFIIFKVILTGLSSMTSFSLEQGQFDGHIPVSVLVYSNQV